MSTGVFLLVLMAAISHAAWNFAARKISGNFVVMWLAVGVACIFLSPWAIGILIYHGIREILTVQGLIHVIATGLLHTAYFALLASAYRHGEISVVYPVSRGSGVGLTAAIAWSVLNENISPLGFTGIGLIVAGILAMGGGAMFGRGATPRGFWFALGLGATIGTYTINDKMGVDHVHPVVYIWFMYLITLAGMWPILAVRFPGDLRPTASRYQRYVWLIGLGSAATYLLILFAYRLGAVSYIVAIREFAVVVGSVLGFLFLKERLTVVKMTAIVAITAGLVCIKMG